MIRLISDSTSDLSDELIAKYNVEIVPLHIVLGEEEYKDKTELTVEKIFEWSDRNNTTPKTSAVGIGEAVDAYQKIIDAGDEIIVFSISAQMSTANNVFKLAAAEIEAEDKISVIDSKSLSTGIGLLICEAGDMIQEGKSRREIVERIEQLIPRVRASFVVDTLTYLHRGGRCSGMAAFAGSALKLHPEIRVVDGAMIPGKKFRGKMTKVVKDYAEGLKEQIQNAETKRVFITHSICSEEIIQVAVDHAKAFNDFDEVFVTEASGVISSHCGPGTIGILFIEKE